uniref:hypothetical protein n=2 Tax=Alistipes TaxID=239759 RepID=UPI003FD6C0A2
KNRKTKIAHQSKYQILVQEILFVGGVTSCNFVLYKIIEGRRLPRRMKGLGESIRQRGNLRVDSDIRILRPPTEIFEGNGTADACIRRGPCGWFPH